MMHFGRIRILVLLTLGALAAAAISPVHAQTYNLFRPANGILVGQTTTYVTTAAAAPNITALFTGTCDNTTYLRGDGTCATPPGTGGGTVNSVGLSAPSVFSVAGSPVTNTGTLALTFATGQTANSFLGTPDGSTGALGLRTIVADDLPAINLTTGVTGTLPVANGGSGVATITGILTGNGTSAFDAALAADVIGLWSGTCNSTTFLRADGSCQVASTGTVTSVALTVPSGFSVTGSPITTSGTLAISGTLNVSAGGTGASTITGPIKGNGTSAFSAAASSDIYGLWSGLCSNTTFLRGDGSCQTPSGTTSAANPTATIGLSVVNGSAGTFMRSDAAPPLSQSITPTWSAQHIFSSSGAGASSAVLLSSATPVSAWNETGAAADAKRWERIITGASLIERTRDDALSAGNTWLTVARTGTTVDSVNLAATTVRANGSKVIVASDAANPSATVGLTATNGSATTFMRSDGAPALSQSISPSWTGNHTFSLNASASSPNINLSNTRPNIVWNETDATTDNKWWSTFVQGEALAFTAYNDAVSGGATWLQVDRTGTTIDSIALSATNVTVNGTNVRDAGILTSGTLPVARGGTGVTTSTGTGNVVLSASPTFTGTVTAATVAATTVTGDGSGLTGLDAGDITAGTLAVARGGTGVTTSTGTGSNVLSASPTLTGTTTVATLAATAVTVGGSNVCRADGTDCTANFASGSYTGTVTGCNTSPTITVAYTITSARQVTLTLDTFNCTGNATTLTVTGAPSTLYANGTASGFMALPITRNSSTNQAGGGVRMSTAGVLEFIPASSTSTTGWTNSLEKGVPVKVSITYDRT